MSEMKKCDVISIEIKSLLPTVFSMERCKKLLELKLSFFVTYKTAL
jgi:hypothetical protein